MDSKTIYLKLKEKSKHPNKDISIKRYVNLVKTFKNQKIESSIYTESHHILPKAKDAFPELIDDLDNLIRVTPRQHFILHWLLFRFFGGSQVYAFNSMLNKGLGANSSQGLVKFQVSSSIYEKTKNEAIKLMSENNKGKAYYKDSSGVIHHVYTNDERVISGELISLTKGRDGGKRSDEWKKRHSNILKESTRNPNKKIPLYFLDIKIEIFEYSGILPEYLDQGWSVRATPEYRSKLALERNRNMSKESRRKAGESISKSNKGKLKGIKRQKAASIKTGISKRTNTDPNYYKVWVFDDDYNIKFIDRLLDFDSTKHKKLFQKRDVRVFEKETGTIRYIHSDFDVNFLPDWLSVYNPKSTYKVFNLNTKNIDFINGASITKDYIVIEAPNGERVKLVSDCGMRFYVTVQFIQGYGIPINCRLVSGKLEAIKGINTLPFQSQQ